MFLNRYLIVSDSKFFQRLTDCHFQWVAGQPAGTRYQTRGQAERDIRNYDIRGATIVRVKDQIPYPESQWV